MLRHLSLFYVCTPLASCSAPLNEVSTADTQPELEMHCAGKEPLEASRLLRSASLMQADMRKLKAMVNEEVGTLGVPHQASDEAIATQAVPTMGAATRPQSAVQTRTQMQSGRTEVLGLPVSHTAATATLSSKTALQSSTAGLMLLEDRPSKTTPRLERLETQLDQIAAQLQAATSSSSPAESLQRPGEMIAEKPGSVKASEKLAPADLVSNMLVQSVAAQHSNTAGTDTRSQAPEMPSALSGEAPHAGPAAQRLFGFTLIATRHGDAAWAALLFVLVALLMSPFLYCVVIGLQGMDGGKSGRGKKPQPGAANAPLSSLLPPASSHVPPALSQRLLPSYPQASQLAFCPDLIVPSDNVCQLVIPIGAWLANKGPIDVCGQDGSTVVRVVVRDGCKPRPSAMGTGTAYAPSPSHGRTQLLLQTPDGEPLADCRMTTLEQFSLHNRLGEHFAMLSSSDKSGVFKMLMPRGIGLIYRGNVKNFEMEITDGAEPPLVLARTEKCGAGFDKENRDTYFGTILGPGTDVGLLVCGMLCAQILSTTEPSGGGGMSWFSGYGAEHGKRGDGPFDQASLPGTGRNVSARALSSGPSIGARR